MNICKVEGCTKIVKSYGYCQTHYKRLKEHGSTDNPPGKGDGRRKHPLYVSWIVLKKRNELCQKWLDFWSFVKDVGERPGKNFNCQRQNSSELFSPDNFFWQERLERQENESDKDWNVRRWKARITNFPALNTTAVVYKVLGLPMRQYNTLIENLFIEQNSLCAICHKPETAWEHKSNKVRRLAVDHCHKTKKVRGLLCSRCNRALGRLKESISIVDNMIGYIIYHQKFSYGLEYNKETKVDFLGHQMAKSSGRCEICYQKETLKHSSGATYRLSVDHCHKTMQIRGLLCNRCNTTLGRMEESIPYLSSMIEYIKKHS